MYQSVVGDNDIQESVDIEVRDNSKIVTNKV